MYFNCPHSPETMKISQVVCIQTYLNLHSLIPAVTPTGKTYEFNGIKGEECCPLAPDELNSEEQERPVGAHMSLGNIFAAIAINLEKNFR